MKRAFTIILIAAASIGITACAQPSSDTSDIKAVGAGRTEYPQPAPGYQDPDPTGRAEEAAWFRQVEPILQEVNMAMQNAEAAANEANRHPDVASISSAGYAADDASATIRRAADQLARLDFPERYAAAQEPLVNGYRITASGYQDVARGYDYLVTGIENQDDWYLSQAGPAINEGVRKIDRGYRSYTQKGVAILWDA